MELRSYLLERLDHGQRSLEDALEGVTDVQARAGADPQWKRYRFGVGLDGSIAGILHHVAAWKHAIADGLEGGGFPDVTALYPHDSGFEGLRYWLSSGHARIQRSLERMRPETLDRRLVLEGESLTVAQLLSIVIEHDHYHAGQINLLRQQQGHLLEN